MFSIQ